MERLIKIYIALMFAGIPAILSDDAVVVEYDGKIYFIERRDIE